MMNRLFASIVGAAVVFAPNAGIALAAASIEISAFTLVRCEEVAQISFNVEVPEEGANDVVEVMLDGTTLFESDDVEDPETLEFPSEEVAWGEHTISATIYDNDSKTEVLASDSYTFDVVCNRSPQLIDGSNAHVNINGSGDSDTGNGGGSNDNGSDSDSSETVAAKKPAVKGATVKAGANKSLMPLNSVFRSVFGRTPTFAEWKYWANRYLTDKPQWDALYGAMQWHKLRGHTMGA